MKFDQRDNHRGLILTGKPALHMIKQQRKVNKTITHYESNIPAPLKVEIALMTPLTNKKRLNVRGEQGSVHSLSLFSTLQ